MGPEQVAEFRRQRYLTRPPELADEPSFVHRVDEIQRPEGYRLVGGFEDGVSHAVAAAGFRTAHSIAWGRFLYVDDLSTRHLVSGGEAPTSSRRTSWASA